MDFGFGREDFSVGQLAVYCNGGDAHAGPVEVGVVKSLREDGAFVAYGVGDTCAKTPYSMLLPVGNDFAAKGLAQRMDQLGRETWGLSEGCEAWEAPPAARS